ncbi:hypothetical protein ACFYKX_12480 [Cytobacillus sp. FJAT-54145]|uniref:Uncharacterized protein n=1 Tax=Cytobacillus spartinae TaxID=3299023 RepID=A0ABW6KB02_9BACI
MFGVNDFLKFITAFFIIFPVVTFIHLFGHIFFVLLFRGKGIKIIIGSGKKLFSVGVVEVRRFYFSSGGCEYSYLEVDTKVSNSLVFLGGSLFNILSILIINKLVGMGVLSSSIMWYQFAYFSFYFVFFALFPMDFPDGYPSDGKIVYRIWKNQTEKRSSEDCHWRTN